MAFTTKPANKQQQGINMTTMAPVAVSNTVLTISRQCEYFDKTELQMQFGAPVSDWLMVLVKELIDNSLDHCESIGRSPHITITVNKNSVSVEDNGDGLPLHILEKQLNFDTRTSINVARIAPSRGRLGNAWKLLITAPHVAGEGHITVETAEYGKTIAIVPESLDVLMHPEMSDIVSFVKSGTKVTIFWNDATSCMNLQKHSFFTNPLLLLLQEYCLFNGHATFEVSTPDGDVVYNARTQDFDRWNNGTSAHWYNNSDFFSIVQQTRINTDNLPLGEFLAQFAGLSSTAKRKQISELINATHIDSLLPEHLKKLLQQMKQHSAAPSPKALGSIGQADCIAFFKKFCFQDSVKYRSKNTVVDADGCAVPFVVVTAFGELVNCKSRRILFSGINFTPTIKNDWENWATNYECQNYRPVALLVHISCPKLQHTDKGKSSPSLPFEVNELIDQCLEHVTKEWCKKVEKIDRQLNRKDRMNVNELSHTDAARQIIVSAYMKASANNTMSCNARQVFYAARPMIQELTGTPLTSGSEFITQRILPDYMAEHPEECKTWRVEYDARGTFNEPYDDSFPLGTDKAKQYIAQCMVGYKKPVEEYSAVLFIEKEGFNDLLEHNIQKQFDIALMSTKGVPTTAARMMVDHLSGLGIKTLVMHDFDVTGFTIAATLMGNTEQRRYSYKNKPLVFDIGLRLIDVNAMSLESEEVITNMNPQTTLDRYNITPDEISFLVGSKSKKYNNTGKLVNVWHGRRVELNAMTSRQLVSWIEQKLNENGITKLVPTVQQCMEHYNAQPSTLKKAVMARLEKFFKLPAEAIDDPDMATEIHRRLLADMAEDGKTCHWTTLISEMHQRDSEDVVETVNRLATDEIFEQYFPKLYSHFAES